MRDLQIGMFAYTGLKPEQMDALAKEVSSLFPSPSRLHQYRMLMTVALRLRHQRRPYLCGRYHVC